MTEQPMLAKVDNVKSEDFVGDVMPLWQFSSINTASQMNKAIPILLKIQDNTNTTPSILEEILHKYFRSTLLGFISKGG